VYQPTNTEISIHPTFSIIFRKCDVGPNQPTTPKKIEKKIFLLVDSDAA